MMSQLEYRTSKRKPEPPLSLQPGSLLSATYLSTAAKVLSPVEIRAPLPSHPASRHPLRNSAVACCSQSSYTQGQPMPALLQDVDAGIPTERKTRLRMPETSGGFTPSPKHP